MHAFVLVNVNVYTKFDVPGFTHSTDMTGIPKFKIGHVRGWFVILKLGLAISNLSYMPNLKSLSPPATKICKVMQNVEKWDILWLLAVIQGHWK